MDKVGHGNQPGDVYPTTIDEVDEVSEHEGAHPLEGVPHVKELPRALASRSVRAFSTKFPRFRLVLSSPRRLDA